MAFRLIQKLLATQLAFISFFCISFVATTYDGLTIYSCTSGHIISSISRWNTYYTASYSAAKKKQVMVHELGHSFGLDHSGSSACAGQPIMYPSSTRFSLCGHQDPQTDDVNGINFLY